MVKLYNRKTRIILYIVLFIIVFTVMSNCDDDSFIANPISAFRCLIQYLQSFNV
jgi:hypothetical protein